MKRPTLYFISAFFAVFACCVASMAQISVDKSTKNLGVLQLYSQTSTSFTLKNTSNETISITKIGTSSSQMTCTCDPMEIAPNGTATVTINNEADLAGRFTRSAYIYTSQSDKPVTLTIKGKALVDVNAATKHTASVADPGAFGVEFGTLLLSTDNIEFDKVNDGDIVSQTIYVTNNGEEKCQPNLLLLPPYLSVKSTPTVLAPGRKGQMTITLDSRKMNHSLGLSQSNVFVSSYPGEKVSKENAIPVSVVLFDTTTVVRSEQAPVISFSTTELNIPTTNKAKAKGTVTITNNGQSMLVIKSIQTLHPAINVSVMNTQIMPGESMKMNVTVIKKFLETSNASHRILLISNDYHNPVSYILVSNKAE